MIYLASPYSHPDPLIQEQRFLLVAAYASQLIAEGKNVYSPIAHWHTIARLSAQPISHVRFLEIDKEMLQFCSEVLVMCLPGWSESTGIKAELEWAEDANIPASYIILAPGGKYVSRIS